MRRIAIIILIISILIFGVSCREKEIGQMVLEQVETEDIEENQDEKENIFVYVCGAVNQEGVYELPLGSRVYEVIALAGGFREDAATTQVNQAEILDDETRIYVPVIGEMETLQSEEDGKVNINVAGKEKLMTLPGVGESRAESILKYREEHGKFQTIEDIMQISGIKEGLFEKIKELITV